MKTPLVLWLICDGKSGHENQSLGLAEAMGRLTPCDLHRISIAGKRGFFTRLRAARAAASKLPQPDAIIGAGHATHPSLLWLARTYDASSIVLMKPSLPIGWFDLCIAPSHDFENRESRPNLLLSRGALNRVLPGAHAKTGKLILIGGPSSSHGWDGEGLLGMLALATDRGGWELSDSRRTPEDFLKTAGERLPGVTVFSHRETPADWLPDRLQRAREVWVTEDSVSMIYEALSSGARVGLLPVPRLAKSSRVMRGLGELVADGFLTPFAAWEKTHRLAGPPETLHESDRCAGEVLRRLGPDLGIDK